VSNIIFNQAAPKKSANLSINADLLQQAKQLNINLRRRWSSIWPKLSGKRSAANGWQKNQSAADDTTAV